MTEIECRQLASKARKLALSVKELIADAKDFDRFLVSVDGGAFCNRGLTEVVDVMATNLQKLA